MPFPYAKNQLLSSDMAIRKIARMGHPVLRQKARELSVDEIKSPAMQQLIDDMIETMNEYSGIGLAAPQIHESIQLALVGYAADNPRYPQLQTADGQPLTVFFNPKLKVLDQTPQGFWEGCLSVPELRGYVERPRKIEIEYHDVNGEKQTLQAEGFLATVFQHEFDHLEGTLYVDRIQDKTKLAFIEEYERYIAPALRETNEMELGD